MSNCFLVVHDRVASQLHSGVEPCDARNATQSPFVLSMLDRLAISGGSMATYSRQLASHSPYGA